MLNATRAHFRIKSKFLRDYNIYLRFRAHASVLCHDFFTNTVTVTDAHRIFDVNLKSNHAEVLAQT